MEPTKPDYGRILAYLAIIDECMHLASMSIAWPSAYMQIFLVDAIARVPVACTVQLNI